MVERLRGEERIAAQKFSLQDIPHVRSQRHPQVPPSTADAAPRDVAHQVTHVAL